MADRGRNRSRSPVAARRGGDKQEAIQERLKKISGMENGSTGGGGKQAAERRSSLQTAGKKQAANKKIDREKTCPLLLRVFCNMGTHHKLDEFGRDKTPSNELQVYTWRDATLKELMNIVKEVNPEARRDGTYFDFAIVYPNYVHNGLFNMKDLGTTCSGQSCPDDNVSLQSTTFRIGDFLDIAIMLRPRRDRIDSNL